MSVENLPPLSTDVEHVEEPVSRVPEVFVTEGLEVYYGSHRAVRDVNMVIRKHEITAFIAPCGCGKSTVLRCWERMNALIDVASVQGKVVWRGGGLYDSHANEVEVRRRIGMVLQ